MKIPSLAVQLFPADSQPDSTLTYLSAVQSCSCNALFKKCDKWGDNAYI